MSVGRNLQEMENVVTKGAAAAEPMHKAFEYAEGTASRAQPGFVLITFRDGIMMPPELCERVMERF